MAPPPRGRSPVSGRKTRISAALGTAGLSLFCLLIVLTSGLGSAPGGVGWLSFAVIDCSDVQTKVDNQSFRGLPDANDFSKHKDFYALYLWTYCSGHLAPRGGGHAVDFCASSGTKSLFNLYRYWAVWGAQVHQEGTRFYWLEHGPNGLYMAYLAAAALGVSSLLVGRRASSTNVVSPLTVFLSSLSFAAALMTAAAAQFTFGQLMERTSHPDVGASPQKHGHVVYILNWISVASALASFALLSNLSAGNTIRRAPTLDTKGMHKRYEVGETTSADSPVSALSARPIRRKTLLSSVGF
ncbi:hypothetical protein F5X68DRAFT_231051 [Plectosphaerella plurivora]|uniref:Uncharacterized protein n=1 Tax=Plectosphaerella plurivora TaxID=936078 RepID=A0A9P9ADH4_9PEZI|nr:hypothetical protein F5X68DRAFT_231051 [Plectosphaerella plurivora]